MPKGMSDNRMEKRLRREIEGLYGNEALTSDLDDNSAQVFLKWAEDRVRRIVESTTELDDEAADETMYPRLKAVRRMARTINQAVRGRGEASEMVEKILQQARLIYGKSFVEPDRDQLKGLLSAQLAPAEFIQTLKHFLEGEIDGEEEDDQQFKVDDDPIRGHRADRGAGRFRHR